MSDETNKNIFVPVSKTTRPENLSSKLDPPKTKSLEPTKVIVCDRTAGGWIPCTGKIAEINEFWRPQRGSSPRYLQGATSALFVVRKTIALCAVFWN